MVAKDSSISGAARSRNLPRVRLCVARAGGTTLPGVRSMRPCQPASSTDGASTRWRLLRLLVLRIPPPQRAIPKRVWAGDDARGGPAHRVGEDLLDHRVVVGGERLVARAEVEDLARAAVPAAAAAEDLAAGKAADQD